MYEYIAEFFRSHTVIAWNQTIFEGFLVGYMINVVPILRTFEMLDLMQDTSVQSSWKKHAIIAMSYDLDGVDCEKKIFAYLASLFVIDNWWLSILLWWRWSASVP